MGAIGTVDAWLSSGTLTNSNLFAEIGNIRSCFIRFVVFVKGCFFFIYEHTKNSRCGRGVKDKSSGPEKVD